MAGPELFVITENECTYNDAKIKQGSCGFYKADAPYNRSLPHLLYQIIFFSFICFFQKSLDVPENLFDIFWLEFKNKGKKFD
jgi:hypothetical protein